MRTSLSIILVVVACGHTADPPVTGTGSAKPAVAIGSGSASVGSASAPPPTTACLAGESQNQLSYLAADAAHATFCVSRQGADEKAPPIETCLQLDYASGGFASVTRPKTPQAQPRPIVVDETGGTVQVCRPGPPRGHFGQMPNTFLECCH